MTTENRLLAIHNSVIGQMRVILILSLPLIALSSCGIREQPGATPRERIPLNEGWRFMRYGPDEEADRLVYDTRPVTEDHDDGKAADTRPTEAREIESAGEVLKPWILPTANRFISDTARHHVRPPGNPGADFLFVQTGYDDSSWEVVDLPHDWGIEGPFLEGWDAEVGGGMGRLASHGVAWYRRNLDIPLSDTGRSVFLDVDGAMSYAMVWLNGNLVGGWPYGYNSWRLDLTPFVEPGGVNQLAIRLDNPPASARWYPGGGIYRNVWLVKTGPVHVGQYGTWITTRDVSAESAVVDIAVTVENDSEQDGVVEVVTEIYGQGVGGVKAGGTDGVEGGDATRGDAAAAFTPLIVEVPAGGTAIARGSVEFEDPHLWGPPPTQQPYLYLAVSWLYIDGVPVDRYETRFGIRSLEFDPDSGLQVNGERIPLRGVNQHHDLGALGAAFNRRAAERQLEILREMGCNAIRTAHNPPAPELLELTDRMGFLVVDEIFDVWEMKKTPLDFHLIFPDWHEADLRSFVRRDRNSPSVIMWSFGNEVGEQYTGEEGAALGRKLYEMVKEEDPTRPATASMNFAKPGMHFPEIMDLISLNYQGEGIRDAPAYSGLRGIRTAPLYPAFREAFPGRVIVSSETASALSSRGTYLFPVFDGFSAPVQDGAGGDPETGYVSAYELYTAAFGSSADKVFASQDRHPYVAGEFVWSGWDYLGEPTPYYLSRSSYCGIIDLAGFPKDRFYLYQSRWRPDLPMVHILPHWNWPERVGKNTPVHVFTSGDEAELFLNGRSLGRKRKGAYEYRLRWDSVRYEPGELRVVAWKDGRHWAESLVRTTGEAYGLTVTADRDRIIADGEDLSFVMVRVTDQDGRVVPDADNRVTFTLEGPGEIIATDNGDPTNMVPFASTERTAFNGLVLAIVRPLEGESGIIRVTARSDGMLEGMVEIRSVAGAERP